MQDAQPISIIVPTLNEVDNLPLLFSRIDESLSDARIPYEIIVIDDHSTDGTIAVANSADARYNVSLHMKQGMPGKAFSLLEGFERARYDLVCMIDADLQYPPEAIPAMYHKLQYCNADIVITNRVENETSALRRLSSKVFNLIFTRMLFGINYDTQSGLKLFKKRVLDTIELSPSPWTFDLEFIVRSLEKNYVILSQEIPFSERNAGVPKIHILSATREIAWGSLKLSRTTSISCVKKSYRMLQPLQRQLQRGFVWVVGIAIAGSIVGATQDAKASADPLLSPLLSTTQPAAASNDVTPLSPITNTVASILDPIKDLFTGGSPTDSSNPTTSPSSTTGGSTTASNATPSSSSKPATAGNAASTNASASSTTSPSSTSTSKSVVTAAPTSDTTSLSAPTGKQASYYTDSKLPESTTTKFIKTAFLTVGAGALFILFGIMFIASRKVAKKVHHPRMTRQVSFKQ